MNFFVQIGKKCRHLPLGQGPYYGPWDARKKSLSAVLLAYHEMASQYDTRIVRKCIAIRYNFSESLQLYRERTSFQMVNFHKQRAITTEGMV